MKKKPKNLCGVGVDKRDSDYKDQKYISCTGSIDTE